jgi:Ca2+-binding RTX toxin-like protein
MSNVSVSSLASVYDQLTDFANLSNFWSLFNTAFGSSYDLAKAATFQYQWQNHNFSQFPQIEVVSNGVLGTANGAYAISTNKIYLSDAFISSASQQSLEALILEEFGHFVDAQVNATDTPGDEGELFSALVRGVNLSAAELSRIQTEDDWATLAINDHMLSVERSALPPLNTTDNLVITLGGATVPDGQGYLTTNRTDATVVTFETSFPSSPSYTGGGIKLGSQPNQWSAPPNDTTNYLSVDPSNGTPSTIVAPSGTFWKYFGLYWGSLDDYNSIEFLKDDVQVGYYSGSDIANILGLTDGYGYINFDAHNNNGYFNKIILASTVPAFESDNHAFIVAGNDSPSITLAITSANVTEDGTPNLVYTFTRTEATTNALIVNYSIAGTADATDYTGATPGTGKTITFLAGSATATLTIDPTADTVIEANETVALTLATGIGYTIGTTTAVTGTITNDDPTITLAVSPASVLEDGTPNLVYTFTRTGLTTNALTVNYSIAGTADATDYTGATPGTGKTITFLAGSATATLTLDPTADTAIEANETVALTLATGTGYTIGTTTAVTGTITNDDFPSITLAVAPASVLEDGTPNLVYTFTRTGLTTNALTVNYSIAGTADATDYTGATPGTDKTITFLAGSATATLTLDPTADTAIEANETVALTLATGTSYTVGTTTAVTGTITNDDPTITLGLNYSAISEDSPSNFIYTFTRTGATTNSLTVNYSIAGTALSTDYTGATPGTGKTIAFAAGSATATLTLDPTADTTLESNETVILQLVSGTGYTIGTTATQTATIINDDNTRNQQGTNGNSVLLGKNYSDYLTGGTGNDILNGAGNSDYLTGAAGNDTITGGSGGDTFFFANANLGIDTITDFTPNEDTIFVSASGFGSGLIAGNPLTQTQFILGSSATSASQRFIYNSTNGALSFDGDGNGLGTAKQIATLSVGLALTCEDIFVG